MPVLRCLLTVARRGRPIPRSAEAISVGPLRLAGVGRGVTRLGRIVPGGCRKGSNGCITAVVGGDGAVLRGELTIAFGLLLLAHVVVRGLAKLDRDVACGGCRCP